MKINFLIALIPLAISFSSCAEDSNYTGTYQASYGGQPVTLNLEEADSQVTGTIALGDLVGQVEASVTDGQLTGTVRSLFFGNVPFEASRPTKDQVLWQYEMPIEGQSHALELSFHRGSTAPVTNGPTPLDPGLIGHWRRTIQNTVRSVRPTDNFNTATDVFCNLSADGRFTYGGGVTGASSSGFAGMTGAGSQSSGEWKAENGTLYSRIHQDSQWIPLGQYSLSGNALVIRVGTEKQFWERN